MNLRISWEWLVLRAFVYDDSINFDFRCQVAVERVVIYVYGLVIYWIDLIVRIRSLVLLDVHLDKSICVSTIVDDTQDSMLLNLHSNSATWTPYSKR